jgi:ferredoxin
MLVILAFLALIPASKHLHLVLSPITVFLRSPELGRLRNLDFEKEEVGLETVKDLGKKAVLDALTCVECGRCQVNCPAWGSGKELNPKTIILQTQEALLAGEHDRKLGEVYSEKVLWQCTTCGACENQCPVGIEHTPIIIGARRGLVSNGEAPEYLGAMYNQLERRKNIWDAPVRSRPTTRSRCVRCSTSCGRKTSGLASCRKSSARAIRQSAPATSTCSRSSPTRTSRSSRAPARRRSSPRARTA